MRDHTGSFPVGFLDAVRDGYFICRRHFDRDQSFFLLVPDILCR